MPATDHQVAPNSQDEEEDLQLALAQIRSLETAEAEDKARSENRDAADPELQRALRAVKEAEEAELQQAVKAIDDAHNGRGSSAPTGMSHGDYSDLPVEALLPFLNDTDVNAGQPSRPSAAQLPLTHEQRERADLLIPLEIHTPELLGRLAQYDAGQQRQVEEKWRHALELMIYHRDNISQAPSAEETRLIQQRRNTPRVLEVTLDENFDPAKVSVRNTPGGGDCIVHALEEGKTGQVQSPEDILRMRPEIAAMRSANPGDYRENRRALVQALNDTAPCQNWDQIVPAHVSNELFAAFQACPGMYSGTEMIAQWTMLPGNRDKTVIAIDAGHTQTLPDGSQAEIKPDVMAYRNGQRVPLDGNLTNAMLDDHLSRGDIVIKQSGQHWQSLSAPLITF